MRVQLDRDHLTIGRLSSNDITLPYQHISRSHAELRLQGQTWWVVDLRSTNGLHVAGRRVHESRLAPGVAVQLSPHVTLTLLEDATPTPSYPRPPSAAPSRSLPQQSYPPSMPPSYPPSFPPSMPPNYPSHDPSSYPQGPYYPQGAYAPNVASPPATPSLPAWAARRAAPRPPEQIAPLSALGPRSPYADDEAPFYPQMRPMQPAYRDRPTYAPAMPATPPAARMSRHATVTPQPRQELTSSALDPQGQAARAYEQRRNAQSGPSPLLHVCQTCGQRTQPDAVYCQNCHHAIASECMRCRLSLLPIQDLCPRCQSPNPNSVRRLHRTAGPR